MDRAHPALYLCFWVAGSVGGCRTAVQASSQSSAERAIDAAPEHEGATTPADSRPGTKLAPIETDWCIDTVNALDESTCYVLPDEPTETLLIYLHGIVPPIPTSPQKTSVETVVANAARRARVAALIPRGQAGFGPGRRENWFGWPTSEAKYREYAPAFVASFAEKRKKLEDASGITFSRTYIAGSSSGAYFAALLALHGGIAADGFGIMSGGRGAKTAELGTLSSKPVYIGFGKYDRGVRLGALALAEIFRAARWPVRMGEHAVDHGAKEVSDL